MKAHKGITDGLKSLIMFRGITYEKDKKVKKQGNFTATPGNLCGKGGNDLI